MSLLHKAKPVPPYSKLAPIYDYLMRHVDYHRWAHYIYRLLQKAHPQARTVLDISCGTGSLALRLQAHGLDVFGFDLAADMVRLAVAKAGRTGTPKHFWCGDMRRFALARPVDAVVCTYDSLNYCTDLDCLQPVFANVHGALSTNGLFIFDVCTERNSRRNFQHYREKDEHDGWVYLRRAYYRRKERLQVNEFFLHQPPRGEWYFEEHRQRIYRLEELRKLIRPWFVEVGVFDDFSLRRGSEKSDRVHFMLRKNGPPD